MAKKIMGESNIREEIKNYSKKIPVITLNEKEKGKSFKFYVPNSTALWRAESLYSKEPITISWIKKFKKNKIFFDIGANVGMYTIFSSIFSDVKVYSFEPESNNFQILNQNIILNNLSKKVTAYPFGISEKLAITNLYLSNWEKGGSHNTVGVKLNHNLKNFKPYFEQGTLSVTLDDLITKFKLPIPNYLKIDVDGIEYKIIKSSKKLLKKKKLESILIEINGSRKEDKEIIKTLEKNGFKYNKAQVDTATRMEGPHKGYAEYLFYRN